MSFEPISIKIDDLKLFADVAFAIDSPFFINEAVKLRKQYGITEPLGGSSYQTWAVEHLSEKGIKILFKQVSEIRARMILTANYQEVFEKAVFGCDIENGDYETTMLINFQKLPNYLSYKLPISEMYAILLSPQTRYDDVKNTFARYEKLMASFREKIDTVNLFDNYNQSKSNIKTVRKWYWIRYGDVVSNRSEKPKTYPEILKEWGRKCPKCEEGHATAGENARCPYCRITDQNILEKLVPEYRKRLRQP
ncbi:hypothetical protein HZB78_03540 [Candidatus Collierbacteria bacterium]|nr:hypothetical protein [Candidatus Collierbacteria bacterium]